MPRTVSEVPGTIPDAFWCIPDELHKNKTMPIWGGVGLGGQGWGGRGGGGMGMGGRGYARHS